MRLSNRSIYGVRAVFDLAYHGSGGPLQIREIAQRASIPVRFLEQIFQQLKRARLVKSKRGPKGGYLLAVEPSEITLARIFKALDDLPEVPSLALDDSSSVDEPTASLPDQVCEELFGQIRHMFEQVTIADLIHRGTEVGLPRACYERFAYVI